MKYLLSFCTTVLVLVILLSVVPVSGEEQIYDNMIRLHVIANSDSEEDQRIKLRVRDEIIDTFSEDLGALGSFDAAFCAVEDLIPEIEKSANAVLESEGFDERVFVEIGEENYPERVYENYTLPAGKYTSLRIVIGEGKGQNWWCVLFPPLCTKSAIKTLENDEEVFVEAGITTEGYKLIKHEKETKYRVRFRILELFSGIFGYEY